MAWRMIKKINVSVIGFALLLAGGIMLVTPGPGLLTIAGGLALLGTEYHWAKRLLRWFRGQFERQLRREEPMATARPDAPDPPPTD